MGWHKRQHTALDEPKNPTTLADMIHEGLSVFCWCNRCGHNSTIDPVPLATALGSLFPVPELGGRKVLTDMGLDVHTICDFEGA